jgi:CRP-like cAMP-binding protein
MSVAALQDSTSAILRKGLPGLSGEDLAGLVAAVSAIKTLPAGSEFVRQGDEPDAAYLVLDGFFCRQKVLEDGRRQIIGFYLPGDLPDLQHLCVPQADSSMLALVDSSVAIFPHPRLRAAMQAHPGLHYVLWQHTLVEAARYREGIVSLGRRNAYERLGHLLCEIYRRSVMAGTNNGRSCRLPVTQADLGDALGLSTIHINRSLQQLRAHKFLQLQSGTLTINDWDGLASAVFFDDVYLQAPGG